MPKTLSAVCVWLALACASFGAGVKGPSEIKIPANRLAVVPLEIDADESEHTVVGVDCDAFREYDPDPKKLRLRVIGYKPTVAWVVVSSAKAGKLQPMHRVQITIGDGPPPVPPTPPTPVDPVDPELVQLAFVLKNAAVEDSWHPSKLTATAKGYRNAAAKIRVGTVADVFATLKAEMGAALERQDVSPSVYSILEDRMNQSLPRGRTTPMDQSAIDKAKALFTKLAAALERAAQ